MNDSQIQKCFTLSIFPFSDLQVLYFCYIFPPVLNISNMKRKLVVILLLGMTMMIQAQVGRMMYGDTSRIGIPHSKDPHVVNFKGRYLMYYSIPPLKNEPQSGWNIGIAESHDLINWTKVGEITPVAGAEYEKKGLCAPGALVRDGVVHLFYQTYGNREKDAICHATSEDGINFKRNPTNPIFRPTGDWNCGRAIDAEVCEFKGKYYLYFASRDKDFKIQLQGVAVAPKNSSFNREDWKQACDAPILYPELGWEKDCIEGASIVKKGKKNISYKDYLKLFLLTKGNFRTVCYRMMDIMQENIASKEPGFLMENCLFSYSWKGSLAAGGVKLNFVKQCSY